jgi:hypothetical protein
MTPREWTSTEITLLKELWPGELRALAIASRLNRTVNAVGAKASSLGLKKKTHPFGRKRGMASIVETFLEFTEGDNYAQF